MTDKPRFAVLLSGCGVFDGAEIHESVLTLLAIDRQGGVARCFAPDRPQYHVIDHRSGQPTGETRNVLCESARIARGAIDDLADFDPAAFDALILPGGFGAAKNLCSFAIDGADCAVDPTVERALRAARAAGLAIGALCIAPVVLARVFGEGVLTIGSDAATAEAITALGAHHQKATHAEVVVDRALRLVSSPCYMLDASISQIAEGAENTVKALIALIGTNGQANQG
ncbi:isoprenoid biosynthesis glyoxalase ElbB [Rhodospirillum rubrum]|uniref:ThiJ/PfpI n=1 Tax=Rhodospirillum rubrum (strain ATCC 11170 / ATH 1.1.1 / DSM 467 / LMG 4362 / NCIMB 8255 / S1) TaxID=269796 RepID=Q2RPB9_RHORT|nr:isoprenoid biosynthesis glyoxalase ElbB [Rhodospirillum rubrum]ABC24026.1 ThiJ/PfpI [Rhodospirillum rubrum ATCC 11170]AEO49770.1 isoprenoid biosynthesis protein with amidotransferase-like domain [Rhodospirillum rubrum F11]MBK5955710.1 isoprenoid biosynthesis protein ElbB [Rhodospirillum rubrum]QXG79969.1 isoprenoid biosynthesis glyoxalase ElbB [Rhodospirillum rubrum]HAQ00044.1 isoprenoid biosynthesis protein ElbB [Rhodospirillum rubrum]